MLFISNSSGSPAVFTENNREVLHCITKVVIFTIWILSTERDQRFGLKIYISSQLQGILCFREKLLIRSQFLLIETCLNNCSFMDSKPNSLFEMQVTRIENGDCRAGHLDLILLSQLLAFYHLWQVT